MGPVATQQQVLVIVQMDIEVKNVMVHVRKYIPLNFVLR